MLGYENWKPDDLTKLYANKEIWHSTTDENEKKKANEANKQLRKVAFEIILNDEENIEEDSNIDSEN